MKKLVKTAKQQFEERLGHFNLMQDWNNQCSVGRIGKDLDGEGVVIFIHESEEDGFSEYHYPSFSELRDDSNFVQNCLKEFSCGADEFILSMVRWFTYDSTENPFDAVDIYFPADTFKLNSSVEFHDLYEEVPDVRIITAKEQWEEDSTDANVLTLDEEHTLKVKITDKNVVFYRSDDMYARIEYPSLEQMRTDTCFVCEVTDSMNEANMQDDIAKFLRWVRVGGDFPIPLSVIFYSDYQNYKFEGYEDKELPQEQTIEKKDFSDRFSFLKSDIIANIGALCENGASIDIEILFESYSIAWIDGAVSYFEDVAGFSLMKTLEGHWKYGIEYGHDKGKTYDGRLELLTLESLLHILDSLH